MGKYTQGEKVTWRSINGPATGTVIGFQGPFAVVRLANSYKCVLVQNEPITRKSMLIKS